MNNQQYREAHRQLCEKMMDILAKKGVDYSTEDPIGNFRRVEQFNIGITLEQGIFTRICDKMSRLANMIRGEEMQVTDESFDDTCLDAANYLLIMILAKRIKGGYYDNLPFTEIDPQPEFPF